MHVHIVAEVHAMSVPGCAPCLVEYKSLEHLHRADCQTCRDHVSQAIYVFLYTVETSQEESRQADVDQLWCCSAEPSASAPSDSSSPILP